MTWPKALPLLFAAAALAQTPEAPLPRAKWIENGIIDAGGSHEPWLFVVRRGGQRLDARNIYERDLSESTIKTLAAQGVEVFHTHLYKGFGMAAEMPAFEDAKRAAAIAHKHGMKVDSYVQWNTMMYETFFAEEPRAKDWIQRDAQGKPILLTYGYQQSFRYRPCFANKEYLNYLKKIVRYAVEEVKTDFIHFDNFDLNPEPDSCQDATCVRGFREFLKKKYTAEKRRERFGFENVDFVNPPLFNAPNPAQKMQIIFDPAIQEWIDYRCQVMADALHEMAAYAKSLNPEVVIEINPHGITGGNRAWEAGLDHARLLKNTEVFWTEEGNQTGLTPDGRVVSKIRSYKLARAFDNILFAYTARDPIALAECLTFNQTIGYAGNLPLDADTLRYIDFYKKNRDLYNGAKSGATVAVLRSYASIAYNHQRTQLSAIMAEQALIEARIPFDLVFDEHLADLSKYKTLVLPDSECLSDAQLASIRRFVAQGGGLVAVGQAGMYDEWRRVRVKPGLAGMVDGQRATRGYEERPGRTEAAGTPQRKQYEKGRAVWLPSLRFPGARPPVSDYFEITNRWWKRPANAEEFEAAVTWASRGELPVEITGPHYLVADVTSQPAKRRMLVHLVNYSRKDGAIKNVAVRCRVPEAVKEVKIYSPDAAPATVPAGASFSIPEVKTYAVAVVSW